MKRTLTTTVALQGHACAAVRFNREIGKRLLSICAVILLGLESTPTYAAGAHLRYTPFDVSATLLSYAVPTVPLKEGQLQLTLSPAYFTYKQNPATYNLVPGASQTASGEGVGFEASYAFSAHVGLGIVGTYITGSGNYTVETANVVGGIPTPSGVLVNGTQQVRGELGSAILILDPFSDPNGFRLPFMLGIGYAELSQDASGSGPSGSGKMTVDGGSPLATVGVAPQIPMGQWIGKTDWFRLTPFAMYNQPLTKIRQHRQYTSTSLQSFNDSTTISHGIGSTGVLVGLPWNLSFLYIPPFGSYGAANTTIYSLTWRKSFGGA